MPLYLVRNDITKMDVDAIVNSANEKLTDSSMGVNHSIHKAAGAALSEECKKLGGCKRGEAKITKGFGLKAKYIIHTVGPIWQGGEANEFEILKRCYENSLELAKRKKVKSIAFPLISSGVFGFPKDKALKAAEKAIKAFLYDNDMDVYLVVFDKSAFKIGEKLYKDIKEYIDDNYAESFKETRRRLLTSNVLDNSLMMPKAMAAAPVQSNNGKPSLEELIKKMDESFQEMLLRKIDESGMKDSEFYKKANIDRKLFSKIRKNKYYQPKKETALALIIALQLPLSESENMLKRAGFAFSESSISDIIVKYFIEIKNYDIFTINSALFSFDQKLLTGNE